MSSEVVSTKVVFENAPQLWLQSAFMALTWSHLGSQARDEETLVQMQKSILYDFAAFFLVYAECVKNGHLVILVPMGEIKKIRHGEKVSFGGWASG